MSHEVVERTLALSKADEAVVVVSASSSVNLRWANNTLTTNGSTQDISVWIISVVGRSFGVRAGTSTDATALEAMVRASEADARAAGDADDFNQLIGDHQSPDFSAPADRTSPAVFEQFAKELGEAFDASKAGRQRLFGFANHDVTTLWMGTTAGARLRHTQPTGSVEWTAKNDTPHGSVWHGEATRDFSDISPLASEELLTKRLRWSDKLIELPPGRYETLLPPSALADMLVYAYWSASGRDAAEGRNAYSRTGGGTRVGEKIAVPGLDMYSDPADSVLGCTPFVVAGHSSSDTSVFDNAMTKTKTKWIDDGVLTSLLETRKSAAERNVAITPDIDNLIVDAGGSASLDDMIARTERGLLLTCLWYIREVDPQRMLLTGLTRDGVYLVEDGEIKGAVNNFRFNESPLELLGRISEAGASVPTLPREWGDNFTLARMPAVRIPDFNMSTVSPAN